ncbi:GWxTD domain-containing protein [bacterium]|nr:GWxTD domain-containing protein [bacterium]
MNRYKNVILMIWLGMFCFYNITNTYAQEKALKLQVDNAAFRYNSDRLNWEFYYSIVHSNAQYSKISENQYQWLGEVEFKILQDQKTVVSEKWKVQGTAVDLSEGIPMVSILDKISYIVSSGEYTVKLKVRDLSNYLYADSIEFKTNITAPRGDNPYISDIQLASQIQRGVQDRSNLFYKNTLLVIPNPGKLYGSSVRFLYFYAETYQLTSIKDSSNYLFEYVITDGDNLRIPNIEAKSILRQQSVEASVETGLFRVDSIASGTYNLKLTIKTENGNLLSEKSTSFYIYNPDISRDALIENMDWNKLFEISEFAEMDEERVDDEMEYIKYVATDKERNECEHITELDLKRRWLFKFWKKRDSNIATPINEFRLEYMTRVNYSNNKFSGFKRAGWLSDRGRVYIIYGPPSYIDPHPYETNRRPYTIWSYSELQDGVEFVFIDFHSNREFRLVHSDLLGEIQNYSWDQQAKKGVY